MVMNPFNRQQLSRVSLLREDVDGIVFWTKNIGPFLAHLFEVGQKGYPFIIQYAINGYPRTLEYSVVNHSRSIEHMHQLKSDCGSRVAVWRYDPIVLSSLTPFAFHQENFERLAQQLTGTSDEVVISFAQIYKKTKRNMDWAAQSFDFTWSDPTKEEKFRLIKDLAKTARNYGFQLKICAQPEYLIEDVAPAHCIDAIRLAHIAGKPLNVEVKGNREGCLCYNSKDIGDYDTCPHGCVYCYAVANRSLAKQRFQIHDPEGEYLFPPKNIETNNSSEPNKIRQDDLFEKQ